MSHHLTANTSPADTRLRLPVRLNTRTAPSAPTEATSPIPAASGWRSASATNDGVLVCAEASASAAVNESESESESGIRKQSGSASVCRCFGFGCDCGDCDCGCDCEAVVSGDALVTSIAAASIVAKVTRDRLMMRMGLAHPGYGFERHMGYSVPEHFRALNRLGPTIHHRRSFAPVAAFYGETVVELVVTDTALPLGMSDS